MMVIGFYAESNGLVNKEFNKKPPKKKKNEVLAKNDLQKVESTNNEQMETLDVADGKEETFSGFEFPDTTMEVNETQKNDDENEEGIVGDASLNENVSEQSNEMENSNDNIDFAFESAPSNNNAQVEVDTEANEEPLEEENFEEFEEYFDKVLPERPIISDELKKYMDEFQLTPLSLSKEKKEVDTNIHLPEIKNKESDDDIWSF